MQMQFKDASFQIDWNEASLFIIRAEKRDLEGLPIQKMSSIFGKILNK